MANSYCGHDVWVEDDKVCLANDDDPIFVTVFSSRDELNKFIAKLNEAADKAFKKQD